jgi:hypothetical protein
VRRLSGVALAVLLGLVPALAPTPVLAARPDLTIVTAATYDVLPEDGRVAVSVRLTATSHLRDTATRRFFFRNGFLSVLPGTSRFRISGGNGNPKVKATSRTDSATTLRIDLGADLAAGRSTSLRLSFDLTDPGGAPDRPLRISPSIVSFPVWAFATPETPGSSVEVRLPEGYDVAMGRGPLDGPTIEDGRERWTSGTLDAPLEFIADVAGSRAVDPVETARSVPLAEGAAEVLLRAWPDDTQWRDRVGGIVERALPVLEREIGIPWPVDGPLAVEEALVGGSTGYAGVFDPAERRIEISYAATDAVVLHELAHAWFNGALVADRWAAEAFASYYADLAASELGIEAAPLPPEPPEPVEPGEPAEPGDAMPLNAWGPSDGEAPEAEAAAYVASLQLARDVAERAGADGLQRVWDLASRGVGAYRADPAAEGAAQGPPDWRGLVDLLEEETGTTYDDLWRDHVARPEDRTALDARAEARAAYARSIELAGDWSLPATISDAMRAWQFDVASTELAAADEVTAQRIALEADAAAAGLTLPGGLREAFEGGGPGAATVEVEREQAVVDAITAAAAAKPGGAGPFDDLALQAGLLGTEPEGQLQAATASLAAGELESAFRSAEAARGIWESAADVGRSRLLSAALLALALVLFVGLLRQDRSRPTAGVGAEDLLPGPAGPAEATEAAEGRFEAFAPAAPAGRPAAANTAETGEDGGAVPVAEGGDVQSAVAARGDLAARGNRPRAAARLRTVESTALRDEARLLAIGAAILVPLLATALRFRRRGRD